MVMEFFKVTLFGPMDEILGTYTVPGVDWNTAATQARRCWPGAGALRCECGELTALVALPSREPPR